MIKSAQTQYTHRHLNEHKTVLCRNFKSKIYEFRAFS